MKSQNLHALVIGGGIPGPALALLRKKAEMTRERAYYNHRAFTTYAVSSWKSEELNERPRAHFLAAGRKAPGSCQLGDTMEARPKQFR